MSKVCLTGSTDPWKKKRKAVGLITRDGKPAKGAEKESSPAKGTKKESDPAKGAEKESGKDKVIIPDTEEQQKGLVAAFTALYHEEEKKLIAAEIKVSVPTVDKYLKILKAPGNQDIVKLVKTNGRPRIYPLEVDISFIKWARDETVPLNEKTMGHLVLKYT